MILRQIISIIRHDRIVRSSKMNISYKIMILTLVMLCSMNTGCSYIWEKRAYLSPAGIVGQADIDLSVEEQQRLKEVLRSVAERHFKKYESNPSPVYGNLWDPSMWKGPIACYQEYHGKGIVAWRDLKGTRIAFYVDVGFPGLSNKERDRYMAVWNDLIDSMGKAFPGRVTEMQ